MEKITIKVKVDQTKVRNEGHFQTQLRERAHVFKPKKGKGSFKRERGYSLCGNF